MIAILHGYLLEGSGSNLWTRSMIQALVAQGETVHLVCQEPHPERYDFIGEAYRYSPEGEPQPMMNRSVPYPGRCIMHKPYIGAVLPVYVWDHYEEYQQVVPMVDLPTPQLEDYIEKNTRVVADVVQRYGIQAIHANHAVLMSVVAQRVSQKLKIPFSIMPHGSAIEYAVKKDERLFQYAQDAFQAARTIFLIGEEMKQRLLGLFPKIQDLPHKMVTLNLGVNTDQFQLLTRQERPKAIQQLLQRVAGVHGGKSASQEALLAEAVSSIETLADARDYFAKVSQYGTKLPDEHLSQKLRQVAWETDVIMLFVGRLIVSKGIHSIIAVLPEIFARVPRSRLLIVGHGPLREAMELLVAALASGNQTLAENIVQWGKALEGATAEPLHTVLHYWNWLKQTGRWESYWQHAQQWISHDRVLFTGYLTHNELRYLFPSADVAIFPSVVAEAGPLVFLEALASGCFPLGTYFAGMAASIDAVATVVPPEVAELMKIRPEDQFTCGDIAEKAPRALTVDPQYRKILRQLAVERYDWRQIARRFLEVLLA